MIKRKAAVLNGFGSRNRASFRKAISGIWRPGDSAWEAESFGQALESRGSIMPCRRLIGPLMKHHSSASEHHSHSSSHQRYFSMRLEWHVQITGHCGNAGPVLLFAPLYTQTVLKAANAASKPAASPRSNEALAIAI
jgi:hypothetical protein